MKPVYGFGDSKYFWEKKTTHESDGKDTDIV